MQELAYSIHLGSDKNRSKLGKRVAKNNPSKRQKSTARQNHFTCCLQPTTFILQKICVYCNLILQKSHGITDKN